MLTEITLPNDTTPVTLEDCPKFGVFDIYIKPKESTDSDRTHARFNIGRSEADLIAFVPCPVRISSRTLLSWFSTVSL